MPSLWSYFAFVLLSKRTLPALVLNWCTEPPRLPGEFFSTVSSTDIPDTTYVMRLMSAMRKLRAVQPQTHRQHQAQVSPDLQIATHVFVQRDAICKALQHPYDGPFQVLKCNPKFFTLDINGRKNMVSLDHLKPAHLDNLSSSMVVSSYPASPSPSDSTNNSPPKLESRTTR